MPKQADPPDRPGQHRHGLRGYFEIRPKDQASIAALVAAGLVFSWASWWRQDGHNGGMVRIDRADPLQALYQVDVNHAPWPEFVVLPNIGETLARRIVADRDANGDFTSVEDLQRVSGIGPRTLDMMRPYVLPIADATDIASNRDASAESLP
ncbi:MAG: helix-hairpin-helix domain-containing protein [Planctomycetota bacterium]